MSRCLCYPIPFLLFREGWKYQKQKLGRPKTATDHSCQKLHNNIIFRRFAAQCCDKIIQFTRDSLSCIVQNTLGINRGEKNILGGDGKNNWKINKHFFQN